MTNKTKVAILGGGPSGLSTAFWLTTPQQHGRFDVTIYTPGWRIGGKCASGRDAHGRIHEHGLHVLMGCYRNVFATICACYDEWKPRADGAFQKWQDAFTPHYQVSMPERDAQGNWKAMWNFVLPANDRAPSGMTPSSLRDLAAELSRRVEAHLHVLQPQQANEVTLKLAEFRLRVTEPVLPSRPEADRILGHLLDLHEQAKAALAPAPRATPAGLDAGWSCPGDCLPILVNLGVAMLRGLWTDVLLGGPDAIDKLDALDWREWLDQHGAWDITLASPPVRSLYDLTFAFPGGDASDMASGRIAAGVTLRFMLEATFGFAGAPLWKMNAGTGDTLFTPLYQVLRSRGVKFRFFHRVEDIAPAADGSIGRVTLNRQANVAGGAEYQPLVDVERLDCWPAAPLWDQLENGAALRAQGVEFESPSDPTTAGSVTLQAGADFDLAVLAIPPEVTKTITPQLQGRDADWDAALANSSSVATGAFQLWLKPTLQQLGWTRGSTILTAYQPPFESWGDMSHLVPREPPSATQTIAYFCGCLPDPQTGVAQVDMASWLRERIGFLWPNAAGVAGADGRLDPALVEASYARQNTEGSERYVLTPPGSVQYRLSPSQPVFGNLYVAGDWTRTRFSGGCVEAAFESGVLAADAIAAAH